ncbi:phospholipase D-like domain-containing protein [Chitinophaga ginsengisoli]|uniref:phospholipase D n=1 Tax=Chitinophaga ginsengisoli TaxID=363837 RepID=A0A2P8GLV9_9BACT|nr:phospholipase D-like domain-containing protein [Chitinophaga ginsengisoli]PSL34961.1 phospholipase D-like protein [Chitinophaga ginsengisoli]
MSKKISLVPDLGPEASVQVPKPEVKAYANNDQVIIAWHYSRPIKDCVGFAVYRQLNDETEAEADALPNRVGFAGEPFKNGEQRPSTEWPIQRFTWTDFSISHGDKARYSIVPILYDGTRLKKDRRNASEWTPYIHADTGVDLQGNASRYHAYFNRGVVSSQFFSRMREIFADELPGKTLKAIIEGKNNRIRDFLGGFLDNRLFGLLDQVIVDNTLTINAAFYELHQQDFLDKLCQIGNRAHIILANGAAKKKGEDKNADSRALIKQHHVDVYDRIVDVTQKHFAHNKFIVISKNGHPLKVWSGSTNITPGGMFAQVNNGILIEDPALAQIYLDEWTALKRDVEEDKNEYGDALYEHNSSARPFGNDDSRVWFSPTSDFKDLEDVESIMEDAKHSILFLMFNPGPNNTFFNYIQDLQSRKKSLFIHGIINQDPGASSGNPLIFFHKGQKVETDWDAILPKNVSEAFSFWYKEISAGLVTIHSKVLVIDPFGEKPYVITGSHNFGPKASRTNDENLLVIQDASLATQYAVNIMAVYDHYRWRYSLFNQASDFTGLTRDREWMRDYMSDNLRMKELKFWLPPVGRDSTVII